MALPSIPSLFTKSSGKNDELSSVVNSAKTLLANIRFMSVDNPVRTVAITSAVPNEGKTFVTANLASAIATSGKTVLLVECDMRRCSMAHALNVHAQHGLYSVVSGEVGLTTAAISTTTPNLYFLDAEPHIPNPSDLLNSNRFARLIEVAKKTFDYVVFDTPPVGTFVDAAVLGTKVDAVFMVVRENFTKKAEVVAAAEQLKKSGCNLAGIVMNYCERRSSEYYYEYYYSKSGHRDENAPTIEAGQAASRQAVPQRPARQAASGSGSGSTSGSTGSSTPLPQRPARRPRAAAASDTGASATTRTASPSDTDMYTALAANSGAASSPAPDVASRSSQRAAVSYNIPRVYDEEL